MAKPSFEQVAALGFIFPGARMWADKANMARVAQDAVMICVQYDFIGNQDR